jgi:tRNA A-37 threonylcarbamoyl transferase component Bud32
VSSPTSGLEADLLLGKRYRLVDRIAGGGMGEVWRARDEVLDREVAVKILRREYAEDETFLARFRAEARHAANLTHSGIAAVYDFGEGSAEAHNSPFLVMENVPGEALSALISRDGPLPAEQSLDIVGQAALALQAAHDAGVIHRDIKPGNLLVTPSGVVKITDFGIARATNSVPLTQTGAIMGTAYYISPEQASGGSVTPASDIYSLGIVAYECLTGRRPFAGDTPVGVALAQVRDAPPALPDTVPGPVRELVMRMLAKEPEQRASSAGDLGREALALRPALAGPPHPSGAQGAVAATRALPLVEPPSDDAGPAAGAYDERTQAVLIEPTGRRDTDTNPGFHLPSPSTAPAWLPYVGALVLFVLLLVVLRACDDDPADNATTSPATESSQSTTAPATVDVAAEDYLTRPVADVRADLTGLGLRVEVDRSEGGGQVGTVKVVSPTGELEVGDLVTLDVVSEPTPPAAEAEKDKKKPPKPGKGNDKKKGP